MHVYWDPSSLYTTVNSKKTVHKNTEEKHSKHSEKTVHAQYTVNTLSMPRNMYEGPQKERQLYVGRLSFGQMGPKANLLDTPGPKRIQARPQLGESRLNPKRETMASQCLGILAERQASPGRVPYTGR